MGIEKGFRTDREGGNKVIKHRFLWEHRRVSGRVSEGIRLSSFSIPSDTLLNPFRLPGFIINLCSSKSCLRRDVKGSDILFTNDLECVKKGFERISSESLFDASQIPLDPCASPSSIRLNRS